MAITYTQSGSASLGISLKNAFSGDQTGSVTAAISKSLTFAASGGDAVVTGFWYGVATCASGSWLFAHASDPLGTMGNATYSDGFTVASSKLKLLYIENTDATNSITIARGHTLGLPIFDAVDDSITLAAGDWFCLFKKAGTAALTTGTNDLITVSVSGGSPTAKVLAAYGS